MTNFFGGNRETAFTLRVMGESKDVRPYEDLPEYLQNTLDQMARVILDPEAGQLCVIGFPSSGKSFIIEQFVSNLDRYLSHSPLDFVHFIELSRVDNHNIEMLPGGINQYLDSVCQAFSCSVDNICLVTEFPEFASYVYAHRRDVKIILETTLATHAALCMNERQASARVFSSWAFVNANEVVLTQEEAIFALLNVMVPKLEEAHRVTLSKEDVESFVSKLFSYPEFVYNEDDELPSDDFLGRISLPPGMLGLALRRLASNMAYSSDKDIMDEDGNLNMDAVIETTIDEVLEEFQEIVESQQPSMPTMFAGQLPPGFENFAQVFQMGQSINGEDDDEPHTKLPITFSSMASLSKRLCSSVMGQEEAISALVEALAVPAAGIGDETKPMRTLLFAGPTGVGKTQLALTLAQELAEEPLHVIRLDMSEYAQPHEAIKLLGSPAGFVGYSDGGILTNQVLKHPRSIILLDEVEKAHHKVWDSFLQVFDSGRMTDNQGNVVDFTQTVIIMTSNLGAKKLQTGGMGFAHSSQDWDKRRSTILRAIEEFFRPEFINRLDDIIFFNTLSQEIARNIVRREIGIVSSRVENRGYKLQKPQDSVVDQILTRSNFDKFGARDIQRMVFKNVSQPVASHMLSKARRKTIALTLNGDKIEINK